MKKGDAIARADPAVQRVYSRLLKGVQAFGPVNEERAERSVLLRSRGGFLGVHPKRDGLDLQIVTDHVIPRPESQRSTGSPRDGSTFTSMSQARKTWTDSCWKWLREAYDLME